MKLSKEKDLEILTYKEDKCKELIKNWKDFNISQEKIDKMEAKELKYKDWKTEVENK